MESGRVSPELWPSALRRVARAAALCLSLSGCVPGPTASPGVALWIGLNHYRDEMARLERRPERWPDRQELAGWLKGQYGLAIGRSSGFYRLVDLDLRRREYRIALSNSSLRPERAAEIRDELSAIERESEALKASVKAEIEAAALRPPLEDAAPIAAVGLLSLAIDRLVAGGSSPPALPAVAAVGRYLVIEEAESATVTGPDGRTHRCTPVLSTAGPALRCEEAATR
jgi:hypothetical protein